MKLNDGRKYLKSDTVKNGDSITFKSEGEWLDSMNYKNEDGTPKKDFVMKVEHNGEQYDMTVNFTNRKEIIAAFGDETSDWVGKTVKVEVVKVMVGGKAKNSIMIKTPLSEMNTFES